ncbi:Peptidoglycan-binding protein ArfA [Shimia sp. SK013]|uniref:OmpA family protein n=1 Tax=Shimia sp. SK013 TaxID=1389006 RepID=UPI0006CC2DD5|nr:OmpA family protein [Shimia sp. SK013]KPA20885.1 Peptidoglycan-binding protein ArfA [Shimia sp. SK013]
MRLSSLLIVCATFATAALLSVVAASLSADLIEDSSREAVKRELSLDGQDWADVHAEGLNVFLAGTAPTEAARFRAMTAAGRIVDAARVIDNMQVVATADIAPPRFSVEILRNDAGISLIGLVPESSDRAAILRDITKLVGTRDVTDLLETAAYDAPVAWAQSLDYAIEALRDLPRSKISVEAGQVSITAMANSPEDRQQLSAKLVRTAPATVDVNLNISAPRPVITPFTLRFLIDEAGAKFDACSADTDRARTMILTAARDAGLPPGRSICTIGLGVPSPTWADAVETAIKGLAELGQGSVTFSDADITLIAAQGTDPALFDKVVGEVESGLPDVFALSATLPATPEAMAEGTTPEFNATLSPEGLVQLRGRLSNEISRTTTESYAHARFGSEQVYMAARLDDTLPQSWPFRVMAGLDALAQLHNGSLMVTPESLAITGRTGDLEANARIAQILADKLSSTDHFSIDVLYLEELDPLAALPTVEECIADIQGFAKENKIVFEPGSGTLDASAADVLDSIAIKIADCPDLQLEIQGHTDSQGRESMNQALSQTRAQSVLTALQDRRILTKGFVAIGYGESQPIADNETQEGREANRRIEFVQVVPEAEEQAEGDAEADAATDASDTATSEPETANSPDGQAQTPTETDGQAVDSEAQEADTDSEADADNAETADPDAAGEETTNDQN